MTHKVFGRAAVAAALVIAGLPAKAQIHGGSLTPPNLAGGGITNFDNVNAPCDFDETTPLLGLEQFGVFVAPAPNGGAILNECGNFGINPLTPPNFLAFNNTSEYLSGGIPRTPDLIGVGQNKTTVSLWLSGGSVSGFFMAVVALGKEGVEEMVTTTTSPEWVQIILVGAGIEAVALVGNPLWLVVDDIEAQ